MAVKVAPLKPGITELRVTRSENHIIIHRMNHPSCVSSFLRAIQHGIEKGFKSFIIEWKGNLVFPDTCVPIAGIISHYKEKHNIDFSYILPSNCYLQHCGFTDPFSKSADEIEKELYPFDKLFKYSNSTQVAALTQTYINCISGQTECSDGVLTGLIWYLNEVMDNVLVHSKSEHGFVMAQYHQAINTVAICVYDNGIGIYNSLKKSVHRPRTAIDAITLAIQEGIGDGQGQGNGLFGLYQIVKKTMAHLPLLQGQRQ